VKNESLPKNMVLAAFLAVVAMVGAEAQQNPVNLTTAVIGGGVIVRNPDQIFYEVGTIVSLSAIADEGFVFESWSGPVADPESAETTILLKSNTLVSATFVASSKPQLKVEPDSETPLDFGVVETGLLSNAKFRSVTVTNLGGGVLEGTANVRAGTRRPYGLVSGGNFSLTANQSAQILLVFDPFNVNDVSSGVRIDGVLDITSNGGNAAISLTGLAVISSELGCSCATIRPDNLPWGDALLLLATLGVLAWARPRTARAIAR